MKIGKKISQLEGKGLELLVSDSGMIRAEFFDGSFIRAHRKPTDEESERSTVPVKAELAPEVRATLDKLLEDFMKVG